MMLERALQGRHRRRWVENSLGEKALVFGRETEDLDLLDRPVRRLLRGGDHKVAEAASLNFRCALDDRETVRADTRLNPGRARLLLGHRTILMHFARCTVFHRTLQEVLHPTPPPGPGRRNGA